MVAPLAVTTGPRRGGSPPAKARGSDYAELLRRVKDAGLLDRRPGYSWVATTGMKPVLAALRPGVGRPAGDQAYLMRSSPGDPELDGANLVLEVASPEPCVIVRAADGVSVVLPAVGLATVPRVEGNIRVHAYPWPRTAGKGAEVDQAHTLGALHHLDFCSRPDHWDHLRH
jgi:hypothetical protein